MQIKSSSAAVAAESPVTLQGDHLKGSSAVIDKDFASCLLAKELDADMLIILTAVEKVAVNFGKKMRNGSMK